jgi:hypothetical protein
MIRSDALVSWFCWVLSLLIFYYTISVHFKLRIFSLYNLSSRVMGFSNPLQMFSIFALFGMGILKAQGYALSSPHPAITAAPNLHAQILKRQKGAIGAPCTLWSIIQGRVLT